MKEQKKIENKSLGLEKGKMAPWVTAWRKTRHVGSHIQTLYSTYFSFLFVYVSSNSTEWTSFVLLCSLFPSSFWLFLRFLAFHRLARIFGSSCFSFPSAGVILGCLITFLYIFLFTFCYPMKLLYLFPLSLLLYPFICFFFFYFLCSALILMTSFTFFPYCS